MDRNVAVLDKHLDQSAIRSILPGWALLSAAGTKPKMRYVGAHQSDEDYSDVLMLAWENDAALITCDTRMLEKAREFGRCGRHNHYLNGVIILPPGKQRQLELLTALAGGRLTVIGIDADDSMLDAICESNLGVDLRVKQPRAIELCDCTWLEDELRRRKRYKQK